MSGADEQSTDGSKSNLDLVKECDNFPYPSSNSDAWELQLSRLYTLHISTHPDVTLGYLLSSTVTSMPWPSWWKIEPHHPSSESHQTAGKVTLIVDLHPTPEKNSSLISKTTAEARLCHNFKILEKWRDELYGVYGPGGEFLFDIERAASSLFGVVTYGVHMTAYVLGHGPGLDDMKIWVQRRSRSKQTYPGMLDNTVAGGIVSGEKPLETIVRECEEEASLPGDFVRKHIQAAGQVSYFHVRDSHAGGETGLMQPEVQYIYDLPLKDESVILKPSDGEAEGFELMNLDEVQACMRRGEFKPNCALVLVDFFIRKGIIHAEDKDYQEITSRLHRHLEFPLL